VSNLILPRRSALKVLAGLIAAPAIARVSSLMPVKVMEPEPLIRFTSRYPGIFSAHQQINVGPATFNGLPIYRNGRPISAGELVSGDFVHIALSIDRWVVV
jgi:hypothetical protein